MEITYDNFISLMYAKADRNSIPFSGAFELTSRCTLDCKMCYIHQNGGNCPSAEKNGEWWINLAKEARDAGTLLLLLTGGEPLLHPDFEDIYLKCREMGLLVSVNTNATLIDDEKVRFFKENPPQRLNITLYGASEETYEKLCGNGKAFKKVMSAIEKLKEANVKIKLNYSITPQNFKDAATVQEWAKEWELPVQPVSYIVPPVRVCGEKVRLSPEDAAREQFLWQKRIYGDDMEKFVKTKDLPPDIEDFGECRDPNGDRITCRAGLSSYWITYDGVMLPCGMIPEPKSEIKSFSESFKFIRQEREKIILPAKCKDCNFKKVCDNCAAVAFAETGSFSEAPEYACQKAQAYAKLALQIRNSEFEIRN